MKALDVVEVGVQALVQDLGRPGLAAIGVGRSGAADRAALRRANRLLGNAEDAAAVEVLLGGFAVRARGDLLLAVTGAPVPLTVDGRPAAHSALVTLARGETLRLGTAGTGLRAYVAVRGGIDVPPVLGSRSTDTLSGIGPPALAAGAVLPVGASTTRFPVTDLAVTRPDGQPVTLRAVRGPRADWVANLDALGSTRWTVSARSDRVATRLEGGHLERAPGTRGQELPSEGLVRGAVQVPPGGQPVLFGPDHPVTGGYPVVAVVLDADVDRAGQLRPGQEVRFRLVR